MRRGRKPKPIERQVAEGDPRKRGSRKLRGQLESTIKAARGLPGPPKHLCARAKLVWRFWKEELQSMKLDCRPDAMMLEGACVNYARAVQADRILAKEGPVMNEVVLWQGEILRTVVRKKKHPAVAISNAAWSQVRSFCSEFGLSPVSRLRLSVDRGEDPQAELAKMLSQPRPEKKETVQ